MSKQPNAKISSIDVSGALAMPGVVDVITAADVKAMGGMNESGFFPGDYPIFAETDVKWVGQPVALVLGTESGAAHGGAMFGVKVNYTDIQKPIVTIDEAIAAQSFFKSNPYMKLPSGYKVGDSKTAIAGSKHTLSGSLYTPMQDHFYLETLSTKATPDDNGFTIQNSSQGTTALRSTLARALGEPESKVRVITRRSGGGFGGKLSGNWNQACAVAVGAKKSKHPVVYQLWRSEQMNHAGKRHAYRCDYEVGFDDDGKVNGIDLTFYNNGGWTYDFTLGSMMMCLMWADGPYFFKNYTSAGHCCRTNLFSNTAMRAPGAINSAFFIEQIMVHIATSLGKDPNAVKHGNLYTNGDRTPMGQTITNPNIQACWDEVIKKSDYDTLSGQVTTYNKNNRWRKQGISLTPIKYSIMRSGSTQAVHVNICADGTLNVVTSGIEIGQGLFTKVAQALAFSLGCPYEYIRMVGTDSNRIPPTDETGGSIGSGMSASAALEAGKIMKARLKDIWTDGLFWKDVIKLAMERHINLSCTGFAVGSSASVPFSYHTWGAAVSVAEIDVLTGETQLLRTEIVYDCGQSLSPIVDIGQVQGAFVQALGLFFYEDMVVGSDGAPQGTAGTWNYKPPSSLTIPIEFNVTFLKNVKAPEAISTLGSKTTGEPPMFLAFSAYFAVKHAIEAAREQNKAAGPFILKIPANVVNTQLACSTKLTQLSLQAPAPDPE